MSAYSTLDISRDKAIHMIREVRKKLAPPDDLEQMSYEQLDRELHKHVYSEEHPEIFGTLYNYNIRGENEY